MPPGPYVRAGVSVAAGVMTARWRHEATGATLTAVEVTNCMLTLPRVRDAAHARAWHPTAIVTETP